MAKISDLSAIPKSASPANGEFARIAAQALEHSPYAALVLEIPAELIVAASPAAAALLDTSGGDVVGHRLEDFTADRPTAGPDLFAGGRLNGFEAFRVLRRQGTADLRVRIWIRSFADQPSSRFVLVVIVADQFGPGRSRTADRPESPAVVGTADANLIDRTDQWRCGLTVRLVRSRPHRSIGDRPGRRA